VLHDEQATIAMIPQISRRGFLEQSALAVACAPATVAAESFSRQAGVAKVVITPEKPVWLAGYGSKRPPEGKLHDLWMKALALEDAGGRRAVLITSDFQGVPKSMSDRVFSQLQTKFQLAREQVMLTFSHNHCGPRLGDDLVDYYPVEPQQVDLVQEYTDLMVTRCVTLVGEALANLAPAQLATAKERRPSPSTAATIARRMFRECWPVELHWQDRSITRCRY
jgi:hypothetical protein